MRKSTLAMAVLLTVVACKPSAESVPTGEQAAAPPVAASIPAEQPSPETATNATANRYQCGDLEVWFATEQQAELLVDGRPLTLSLVPSGSGAKYSDGTGNEISRNGDEVVLTLAGKPDRNCSAASFRATGNEPGWVATVTEGEAPSLHVQLDYGERKLEVANAAAGKDGWKGKAADGTVVTLNFERAACVDDGDQAFEAKASLAVGEKVYKGCGSFKAKQAAP